MRSWLILIAFAALVMVGCGGGGGGGGSTVTITGTVDDVVVGFPNPGVSVSAPGATATTTSTIDGSFTLTVPSGTTVIDVAWTGAGTTVPFSFNFPPITAAETVGPLFIGPEKVTVTGSAMDSTTLNAISGASVTIGGVSGKTNSNGVFTIGGVAYSPSSSFPSLPGSISANGYITANFEPGTNADNGGVVAVGQIGLVPSSSSAPPGGPFNLWGRVSPLKNSPGATVTLSLNGNPFRTATVGAAGTYYFWVPAGTYVITVTQTGFSAAPVTATLTSTSQVLEEDVTLTP